MQTRPQVNLKPFHTFSIDQTCSQIQEVTSIPALINIYQQLSEAKQPMLFLGKGSNVLFTAHFDGTVVLNRIMGIDVTENTDSWLLHVNGGEDWPELVAWSVEQGYWGLENLAMIPGCVGSAPIQNIGAYGVELKDVCRYVDILCLETLKVKRLTNMECEFGYRDSVFKRQLYQKAIVVAVGLVLPKEWKPNVEYGPLRDLSTHDDLSASQVFTRVCKVRRSKLPDPSVQGNAGSFFKNPVIESEQFAQLKKRYPDVVGYAVGDQIKVAAGWLIDHCDLKGHAIGGAQVHPLQALVLVNANNASAQDVVDLAAYVKRAVWEKYQIALEHEVRFIGAHGETSLNRLLERKA